MLGFKNFLCEEDAVGTVELVLLIVVTIAIVVVFKSQLKKVVETIFKRISKDASAV